MDGDLVLPDLEGRVQADGEGGVAVRPAAQVDAVHLHGRVRHGAVDFQVDILFEQLIHAHVQRLLVDGLSPPGELSAFAGIFLPERSVHAPVVGQVHRPAFPVLDEGPAFVEGRAAFRLRRGRKGCQRHGETNDQSSHTRVQVYYANIAIL